MFNAIRQITALLAVLFISACSLDSMVEVDGPDDGRQVDSDFVASRAGALALYAHALGNLRSAVSEQSLTVGVMTDELSNTLLNPYNQSLDALQVAGGRERIYGLNGGNAYGKLHAARVHASQAITVIRGLQDTTLNGLVAGAYAIEGYSIMMLAENHCSGIPLTTLPFEGNVEYGHALSTSEMFNIAIAKFDSSLSVLHDSINISILAKIGKGRAHLNLKEFDKASDAVQGVTVSDAFNLRYSTQIPPGEEPSGYPIPPFAFWTAVSISTSEPDYLRVQVLNHEGENGIEWYSDPSNLDPRVPVTTEVVDGSVEFPTTVRQLKFSGGTLQFPLARGIEALLIRAEYLLQQGDADWIDAINEARSTRGLAALTDPVNNDARIDLLFRERAFWFYLEGVRLSDFRRLVRQYGRAPQTVYPVGLYTQSNGSVPFYGDAYVWGVPAVEHANNYRYKGCLNWNP